jgi:hypothetical protein
VDTPRNIFPNKNLPRWLQDRSWWQKPRHTRLGRALEACRVGPTGHVGAALRRLTPTKHTAGPLATIFNPDTAITEELQLSHNMSSD